MNPQRLPLLMFLLVAFVVVVVIGLSTGSWVWFGVVLAIHLIASAIVLTGAFRSAQTGSETDKSSERLERAASEAAGGGNQSIEAELEALKRQPASDPVHDG